MKKLNTHILYLFCTLVLLSSCNNDDDPEPQNCSPTKITTIESGQTSVTSLTYNAEGRISKIEDENISGTIEYNAAGKPTRLTFEDSPFGAGRREYTYNAQGQLSKTEIFVSLLPLPVPVFRSTYDYNTAGQLTRVTNFQINLSTLALEFGEYVTFTTDANGNVTQEKEYQGTTAATATLDMTKDYTYDAAKNPSAELQFLITGYSSPNNATSVIVKNSRGIVEPDASSTTAYTYNGSNYPTRAVTTTQTNIVTTITIDYTCR